MNRSKRQIFYNQKGADYENQLLFTCLIIELDGSQHYEEKGLLKDTIRTEIIEQINLTVIRIPNNEVNRNFEGVCQYIDDAVKESLRQSSTDTSRESPSQLR